MCVTEGKEINGKIARLSRLFNMKKMFNMNTKYVENEVVRPTIM